MASEPALPLPAEVADIADLEGRVADLEGRVADLEPELAGLEPGSTTSAGAAIALLDHVGARPLDVPTPGWPSQPDSAPPGKLHPRVPGRKPPKIIRGPGVTVHGQ